MKKIFLILILFLSKVSFSQAPEIEWQNTIGSVGYDDLYAVHETSDKGYILGGTAGTTISGDKTVLGYGGSDYWLVKLDSSGNIIWQNDFGGNDADYLYAVQETSDKGFILGGSSNSALSGIKTEDNIGAPGTNDYWIVKVDSLGNFEWENTIGGNSQDWLTSIEQTSDGGYIIGGYSASGISGDKTEAANIGGGWGYDYWVVKTDSLGTIEWENTIGGTGDDWLKSLKQTSDDGYILGGFSNSGISGDKTEPTVGLTAASDYWIIKIDSTGEIEWQKTIGGNDWDYINSIDQTSDGNYILGGYSFSGISGDKSESVIGYDDYWVIKINSFGGILWQNTLGGYSSDRLYSIKQTVDGGYILGGHSDSNISPDKSEGGFGSYDFWVVKLNSIGSIEWDKTLGGNDYDYLYSVEQVHDEPTSNEGYIIGGTAQSGISGNKTEDNVGAGGDADYWVIKLLPEDCIPVTYYADADEDGYGNNLLSVSSCVAPLGYILDGTDCNDLNAAINPDAIEVCNSLDDDCNFIIDDGLPVYTFYYDGDEDGYGDILSEITICNDIPPAGYVIDNTDCDDSEDLIHAPTLYFADLDADLYGDPLNSDFFCSIFPPEGYATNNLDCDDSNILINPVSNEICNNIDDNCNTDVDEGLPTQTLYIDADGDNYGNNLIDTITCFFEITGYVLDNTDCDDSNPEIYPGAPEILNGKDDNCNKLIDEGVGIYDTQDKNAISIYPNPANDKIIIAINNQFALTYPSYISICDLSGKNILQLEFKSTETEIDVSNFASGIYFVKVIVDGNHVVQKLIIE